MRRAPLSVRIAVGLFAVYATLLVAEAAWIGIAPRWSAAARAWADMHPPGTIPKQLAAATVTFVIAFYLCRGKPWARNIIVTWGAGLFLLGLVLVISAAIPASPARALVTAHPRESLAGVVTWIALLAAIVCLWQEDAREFFRPG